MAATIRSNADIEPDINTTPLIDVMLVLLTLLIMTLPMQTHAIKVDTPQAPPRPAIEVVPIDLAIGWDGTVTWDGTRVDQPTLKAYLAQDARQQHPRGVVITADKLAKYDAVARVLADAAQAGESGIGFAQDIH